MVSVENDEQNVVGHYEITQGGIEISSKSV